jgi:hypothetical protein
MSAWMTRGPLASMALAASLCAVALIGPVSAAGAPATTGWVAGEVVSWATGRPVPGAMVRLPDLDTATTTDTDGSFRFARTFTVQGSLRRIRAVVSARGFGSWTVSDLPLVAGDTLRLHAEMRTTNWSHEVAASSAPARRPRVPRASGNTCTGWGSSLVPPPTIKVFLHATSESKQYDFPFYAAHVLPREWIPSWDADALAAGAVAVKTYAWYRAQPGHAYSTGSSCADVRDDTSDQVFDPTYALDSTSQAVYVSMGSVLRRNGAIFLAQYWSGDGNNSSQDWKRCEYVNTGTYAGRMSQWGTQVCAQAGKVWPDIDQVFYTGTTWSYLRNMEWNPSFEGGVGTTPWSIGSNATVSVSSNGAAYNGIYALAVTPNPAGAYASVRQRVPVVGTTTIKYHAEAAFRCTQGNGSGCTITMRVVAVPDSGSSVGPTYNFTVPQDYHWHLYKIDPAAAGIVHSGVSLVFGSHQQFKLDSALVSTPYGGP